MKMQRWFLITFLMPFLYGYGNPSLDQLALESGTDKSSAYHNYTKIYERFFGELREKPIRFLEIGIYKGDSVKLWENYFPSAELHFIDISLNNVQYFSNRSHYHLVDQANIPALQLFAHSVSGEFDIIIDDGGHTQIQQISSFLALFPFVKKGGYYVVEDLHTSYWKLFGGGGYNECPLAGNGTCIEFLKQLVEKVNYPGARTWCADIEKMPPHLRKDLDYFQEHIEGINFFSSLCIIEKR